MRRLREWIVRFRSLFDKQRKDREFEDEIESHVQMHIEDNLRLGMTPGEARRQALIKLGGIESTKEACRDQRGLPVLEILWQDIRYGARMLRKNRGFTAVTVLTLALGIGANGVVFSLVNALLLRPLPVDKPHELAAVFTSDFSSGDFLGSSYPDYADFRDRNRSFAGLALYAPQTLNLNLSGANERAFGEIVSANYFNVLGLRPALGRGFLPEEDQRPGAAAVAVISHRLWKTRFGGAPDTVGRSVRLNGQPFTIVGVAPEKYQGLLRGLAVDWWVPAMMMDQLAPGQQNLTVRGNRGLLVMGRLKPGVTLAQARADFSNIAAQLYREFPQQWENIRRQGRSISVLPESEARVMQEARLPVMIFAALLLSVVALVLLIACANIANLLLARAAARRREIAVRLALGARRGRLIRQLLTESVLLAMLGGAAGLLLAMWGANLLMAFKPPVPVPIEINLPTDWRVIGFLSGLSLLTCIAFSLVPALAASRPEVVSALKDESNASSGRGRLRGALVIVQVAISALLLICAGLSLRSLRNASSIDPGFDADSLLAMSMDLELQGYDEAHGQQFSAQLLDRVRALPGVVSASLAATLPLGFGGRNWITIEGYNAQPGEDMEVHNSTVAPGYFETLRIPLLQGRAFETQDRAEAPGAVIINEAFARRYWPGQSALGKRIQMGRRREGIDSAPYLTVVGVTKDGKYNSLGEEATPFFYRAATQTYVSAPTLLVRTQSNPADALATMRNTVESLDRNLPLYDVKTMRQHLGIALLPARVAGSALGIFGLLALLLAAAGLYGVMSNAVAGRTREIGIRMALGAHAVAVLRLILHQGMKLALIGLTIGLVAALALTHLLKSLLYGISATDPLSFAGIALLLTLVALLACWFPARRATKVYPMEALRHE